MKTSEPGPLDRRNFIKIAASGATAIAASAQVGAQGGSAPSAAAAAAGEETPLMTTERAGADFMVDVIKTLDIEFFASNPGSSFRALQESVINYGGNKSPEWITCMHEEASVAMAHAYSKIEGKPMGVMAHGTVGLQHAAMAIYNAYVDRVPVFIILGNTLDAMKRRPGAEWSHSVQDAAAMVRDYIKWDDTPMSLGHFAESAIRAYKFSMTPPNGPVILVADSELQEEPIERDLKIRIPKLTIPKPPAADPAVIAEVARLLLGATDPVILEGTVDRTASGLKYLNELKELLQTDGGNARTAGVVLALETVDLWGSFNTMNDQLVRTSRSTMKQGVKIISIASTDLYTKSNYQDFQRFQEVDLPVAASGEATLPFLIEEIKRQMSGAHRQVIQDRGAKLATSRTQARDRSRQQAAALWNLSPISSARIAYELWDQIKNKDWSVVNGGMGNGVFEFTKHYQNIGGSGAGGQGYGGPASVGAALANKKHGRLSISFQNDGDLMYSPGALWTAAHHRVPMLSIMNNNRAYHQEVMHLQRMACRHNRDLTKAHIGTTIEDPNIDYAKLAQSMGWYAEGPITNPNDVGPAIKRALAVVEKGEPALLDTVMQPR